MPDAGYMLPVDADGVLFFAGYGAPPAFVQNRNPVTVDVPLSAKVTGEFVLYAAPRSDSLAPGLIDIYTAVFDATGTREIGRSLRRIVITFDENGWSASEHDYPLIGGCVNGWYYHLEAGGPFVVRMDAIDHKRTTVQAEVRVQPSCAIANGYDDPPKSVPEQCVLQCPSF
jgi:hypothetical protein